MSDAPRTDANVYTTYSEGNQGLGEEYAEYVVDVDFARELERELTTAQAEIERMRPVVGAAILLKKDLAIDDELSRYYNELVVDAVRAYEAGGKL